MESLETRGVSPDALSPWWRRTVLLIALPGFGILIFLAGTAWHGGFEGGLS
jgi:hypothetical protein